MFEKTVVRSHIYGVNTISLLTVGISETIGDGQKLHLLVDLYGEN